MLIRLVPNIFAKQDRETQELTLTAPTLLSEIVPEKYHEGCQVSSALQGAIERENWGGVYISNDDEIIISPEIRDPFTLTLAAIAAIAAQGLTLASAWAATKALLAIGFWAASIYVAYSTLSQKQHGASETSPTYGWDGIGNTADPDVPVPLIYGKCRTGGNYINTYVESIDNDHYLNVLIALGEGPVTNIAGVAADTDDADIDAIGDKILVNGNPISNYKDCKVYVRMGAEEQEAISYFHQVHDMHPVSYAMHPGDTITYTTSDVVDNVRFHIQFPAGLYDVSHDGSISAYGHNKMILIEYREFGGGVWIKARNEDLWGKTTTVLRTSFLIWEFPIGKRYDIRLTFGERDAAGNIVVNMEENDENVCSFTVTAFDEITWQLMIYPYTALLGIRVLATSQLAYSLPNITTVVEGLKVNVWDGEADTKEYSRNPIWCMRNLIEDKRYGIGKFIPATTFDLDAMKAEADYCDEYPLGTSDVRFRMDIVIDQQQKAFDWINQLAAGFCALPMWSEGRINILIDRITTATQMFSMGNIKQDSFKEAFASISSAPNVIEIQFANEAKDWKRDIVEPTLVAAEALGVDDPQRTRTMWLPGITRTIQAIRVARYVFRLGKYCIRSIEFRAAIDAVVSQPGDVILFAHDVPRWGVESGRVKSAGVVPADYITLKEILVIPAATTYYIRVRHTDDTMEEKQITSPAGTYKPGDKIYISGTWTTLPVVYELYSVGKTTIVTKPFRILSMERKPNNEAAISAVEYHTQVYDESDIVEPPPQYSDIPDPRMHPDHVTNLALKNSFSYDATIYVSFTIPDVTEVIGGDEKVRGYALWDSADVYLSTVADMATSSYLHGNTRDPMYEIKNLNPGVQYFVKVVSVSLWGVRAPFDDAPQESIRVLTPIKFPAITGLELKGQGADRNFGGRDAVFAWHEYSHSTARWPAGEEPFGAGQGFRDKAFKDYVVEIWREDYGVKLRTEYVQQNEYIYTWEKNYADHRKYNVRGKPLSIETFPARIFVIKVWARDVFNQISDPPNVLKVFNDPPTKPSSIEVNDNLNSVSLQWPSVYDKDFKEFWVFRGAASGFNMQDGNFILRGDSSSIVHRGMATGFVDYTTKGDYYYRIAAIDEFGPDAAALSDEVGTTVEDPQYYAYDHCTQCFGPGGPHGGRTPSHFMVKFAGVKLCSDDSLSELNGTWQVHQLGEIAPCLWGIQAYIDGATVYIYLDFRDRGAGYISQCWAFGADGRLFSTTLLGACEVQRTDEPSTYTQEQCGTESQICYGGTVTWIPQIEWAYVD